LLQRPSGQVQVARAGGDAPIGKFRRFIVVPERKYSSAWTHAAVTANLAAGNISGLKLAAASFALPVP
jgi:hypothetical protein